MGEISGSYLQHEHFAYKMKMMRAGAALVLVLLSCSSLRPHPFIHRLNKTRCEPVAQELENRTIWWGNYSSPTVFFTSKPLCLNNNFDVVKRFCAEFWLQEPTCTRLQEAITPCPADFQYSKEFEICYVVAEKQIYPPKCPYPNVMSFYDYKVLLEKGIVSAPVWFPAETLSEYGVGSMIITEPSRHYGKALSLNYYWRNSHGKRCLIYTSSWTYEAVYCNSTYDAICAYHPLKNVKHNYCSMNQSRPCIMSDFDLNSAKCLCVLEQNCADLAALKLPHQNFVSTNASKCRIGLEKREGDGKYVWAKSQEEIAYSNWAIDADSLGRFGVLQSDVGWSLENEKEIGCAVCEEEIVFGESSLDLKLDSVKKELVLVVTNVQDLVYTGEDYPVFCFTDTPTSTQVRRFSESYFVSYTKVGERAALIRYKYSRNCPGHYWCEAFQYPDFNIIRSAKILVVDDELYGNEFATTLTVQYGAETTPDIMTLFNSIAMKVSNGLRGDYEEGLPFYLRWMTTLDMSESDETVEYLIHITSKTFKPVEEEREEFTEILSSVLVELPSVLNMSELLSVKYCLPSSTISGGDVVLHWSLTKINATVIPSELCLQNDGFPVTRSCFGDFLNGARWTPVNGTCSRNPITSPATEVLYNLLNSNTSLQSVFENLMRITEFSSLFLTIDVHLIARILDAMDKRYATDLTQITRTINNLLNAQRTSLELSQTLLNSTDKILYNFDVLLQNFYRDRHLRSSNAPAFTEIEGENLMLLVFDARSTVIRGVGLYNNSEIKFLEKGVSYEQLVQFDGLEVATYIPEAVLNQIGASLPADEPLVVVMYIFMNDYLFNEEHTRSSTGKIFGVLLPPITDRYVEAIPTLFRARSAELPRKCAFWNYGTSDELGSVRGRWQETDAPLTQNTTTTLELCQFPHTTHFALLLLGDLTEPEKEMLSDNQTVLYVLTTVGCGFSIFGILVILLTFFLFKRWRENGGNQILVQFSLVTLLQFCLLYTSSQVGNGINKSWCVLVGALLHFAVLSQFCWMLVMAVLQYKRFVLVFSTPTKWILLKACLFGYLVPVIPVAAYVTCYNDNYVVGQTGMCYPTGNGLYLGVILPGGCIIIANLIIFCIIIWNIFHRKLDNDYSYEYTLRFRLVFVLFFMLGITWVFGFLAEFTHNMVFVYLFCSTASLQGFIMFLAFVVCNESTRKMYVYLIKTIKYKFNC